MRISAFSLSTAAVFTTVVFDRLSLQPLRLLQTLLPLANPANPDQGTSKGMDGKPVGWVNADRTFERLDRSCRLVRRQMPSSERGEAISTSSDPAATR